MNTFDMAKLPVTKVKILKCKMRKEFAIYILKNNYQFP